MKLPKFKQKQGERESFCSTFAGIYPEAEAKPWQLTVADNIHELAAPRLSSYPSFVFLQGIWENAVAVFAQNHILCVLSHETEGDVVYVCNSETATVTPLTLPIGSNWDEVSPVQGVWIGQLLYLPSLRAIVNIDQMRALSMDYTAVDGSAFLQMNSQNTGRKMVYILARDGFDVDTLAPGHCVQVWLRPEGVLTKYTLRYYGRASLSSGGGLYFEGPQLTPLESLSYDSRSVIYTDYPEMDGMFFCRDRMYGYADHHVFLSAVGEPTLFERGLTEGGEGWSKEIELEEHTRITAGCSFNEEPLLFTANGAMLLEGEDQTPRHLVVPGVEKGQSATVSVIGKEVYYVSAGRVYAFDGKESRLIESGDLTFHDAHCAATDGRRYWLICGPMSSRVCYVYDTMQKTWNKMKATQFQSTLTGVEGQALGIGRFSNAASPVNFGTRDINRALLYRWAACGDCKAVTGSAGYSFALFSKQELKRGEFSPHIILLDVEITGSGELCVQMLHDTVDDTDARQKSNTMYNAHPVRGQYMLRGPVGRRMYVLPFLPQRGENWRIVLRSSVAYTLFGIGCKQNS